MFGLILRIIIGALLLTGGFLASHFWLFKDRPFYNVAYLGQTLAAFLMAAVGLYLIPYLYKEGLRAFKKWITAVIRSSVSHSVGSFMASQAGRLREARGQRLGESQDQKRSNQLAAHRSPLASSPIVLDTSAIIDGRILEVIKLGFIEGQVVVPSFVLAELQTLADSSDDQKRARGRRGLDLLGELKTTLSAIGDNQFEISEIRVEGKDADEKLLKLTKKLGARLCTVDFNLNKAGRVSDVKVLNVNDLSNSVKTPLVPGDRLKLKIVHEGKDNAQGVGYLPDGTMIVVEGGREHLDQEINVQVSRFLQTSAGKMVFGKLMSS